ncbi:Endothelin-converting enzyme 2 [Cytospora mali]|uniref:Endothelin-converting enzyme 2 n=1 Tax=Cytospora mali TaxID=578113 RepID=A0A194VBU6_CYTMA|nr:Endothelin-converting enzyme 2 [Valsa mali var. pyri (nom. inval.)]
MPADFEKQEYWHQRFATETNFEWLSTSEEFMTILKSDEDFAKLDKSANILQIGFGTSDLHNWLRKDGFLNVLNIDYEPTAIDRGKQIEKTEFTDVQMRYAVADATKLDLPEKFNFITDKSTVDAISCGGEGAFLKMCHGVRAHLAPGGFWISMSYSKWRFDVEGLPFYCQEIAKIPTRKLKETDPDIFHHCYKLTPRNEGR